MKRQNNTKKIIPISIITTLFIFSLSMATAAPTVELNPAQPKPKETVTFTATIPDVDDIEQVNIHVEECSSSLCFTDDFNETMANTAEDTYTATITLKHEDAIYFKHELQYLTNDGWKTYPETGDMIKVDLDTSGQTDGSDNGNGDDASTDTPGFETLAAFISVIFISLILYNRRR